MWYLLIIGLLLLSLCTILQTPKDWWNRKASLIALVAFHAIGLFSLFYLLFLFHKTDNETVRYAVIMAETIYFVFCMFTFALSLLRLILFYIARYLKKRKAEQILTDSKVFFCVTVIITVLYLIPAMNNAVNVVPVSYNVAVEKACDTPGMRVALIADLHVGAGAFDGQLREMTKLVNDMEPDVVLIAGDVSDSSSSVRDLELMEDSLKGIHSKYGIYYAEGNHEKDAHYDATPYLKNAKVHILQDAAVELPNKVNIIGFAYPREAKVSDILADNNLNPDLPRIVIAHRPRGLWDLSEDCDLVVCGHTHGYQFPFIAVTAPFRRNFSYGIRKLGDMTAIVTSGVAEWGHRAKWPSKSEVVQIDISFNSQEGRPQ